MAQACADEHIEPPELEHIQKIVRQQLNLAADIRHLYRLCDLYSRYPWCLRAIWREQSGRYTRIDLVCARVRIGYVLLPSSITRYKLWRNATNR